jgi:hypothetical protein
MSQDQTGSNALTSTASDTQPVASIVGVPTESQAGERRVALVPKAVISLVNAGVSVTVESGAGERALLPDLYLLTDEASFVTGRTHDRRRAHSTQTPTSEGRHDYGNT